MASLRHVHRFMNDRQLVQLKDGRSGKIVRVDTQFPENDTIVSVWTGDDQGPGVAKVRLSSIVGPTRGSDVAPASSSENDRAAG